MHAPAQLCRVFNSNELSQIACTSVVASRLEARSKGMSCTERLFRSWQVMWCMCNDAACKVGKAGAAAGQEQHARWGRLARLRAKHSMQGGKAGAAAGQAQHAMWGWLARLRGKEERPHTAGRRA